MNKAFRLQLLSSGSSSLWNTCFRLCSAPTTPVDMSPASWANLLFGGAYCYVSDFCSNELSTIKCKPHGPELWHETSNQSSICISPSCVQVLHHNPVSLQLAVAHDWFADSPQSTLFVRSVARIQRHDPFRTQFVLFAVTSAHHSN